MAIQPISVSQSQNSNLFIAEKTQHQVIHQIVIKNQTPYSLDLLPFIQEAENKDDSRFYLRLKNCILSYPKDRSIMILKKKESVEISCVPLLNSIFVKMTLKFKEEPKSALNFEYFVNPTTGIAHAKHPKRISVKDAKIKLKILVKSNPHFKPVMGTHNLHGVMVLGWDQTLQENSKWVLYGAKNNDKESLKRLKCTIQPPQVSNRGQTVAIFNNLFFDFKKLLVCQAKNEPSYEKYWINGEEATPFKVSKCYRSEFMGVTTLTPPATLSGLGWSPKVLNKDGTFFVMPSKALPEREYKLPNGMPLIIRSNRRIFNNLVFVPFVNDLHKVSLKDHMVTHLLGNSVKFNFGHCQKLIFEDVMNHPHLIKISTISENDDDDCYLNIFNLCMYLFLPQRISFQTAKMKIIALKDSNPHFRPVVAAFNSHGIVVIGREDSVKNSEKKTKEKKEWVFYRGNNEYPLEKVEAIFLPPENDKYQNWWACSEDMFTLFQQKPFPSETLVSKIVDEGTHTTTCISQVPGPHMVETLINKETARLIDLSKL